MMKSQSGDAGRDVNLLTLSIFIRRIPMGFLNVMRPIYFTLLGFDPLTVGLITTIGSIISALDSALFGVLSDKYGRKPFLALGSFTSALRFMLYILSGDFWVLVIAQGIGALGEAVGAVLLAVSAIIIIAYIWLVFFPPIAGADILILKLTGTVAVAGIFAILGWIGYTLATTPPPKPIEEIEKEMGEIEAETSQEGTKRQDET
jgi:predicted DNA-binding transcriptional regulator